MALEVEDGSGKSNAESYVSVTDCSTYCTNMGLTAFTGLATDALREAAIRRAMRWIEGRYRTRWNGRRSTIEQALAWPRYGVVDADDFLIEHTVVPQAVKDAVCEAAEREAASAGSLAPDLARGGAVQQESKKVGPIETSTTFFEGAPNTKTFPIIDGMVKHLVAGVMNGKVVRT